MEKLMTLEEWAAAVYGDHPPAVATLRRWARECRIDPPAEKHGRTYFVPSSARYLDPNKPAPPIPRPANQPSRRPSLVERMRRGP